MPSSVCVFCGSQYGSDPAYRRGAARLGELLGTAGVAVIYGGGHVGLMGAVADAAVAAGGEVIGVIPTRLLEREVGHRAITRLITTNDMFERKQQMIDLADAFVILPGGLGTLDELLDVITLRQLGQPSSERESEPEGERVEEAQRPHMHLRRDARRRVRPS